MVEINPDIQFNCKNISLPHIFHYGKFAYNSSELEKIGSVHDNPELLKGDKIKRYGQSRTNKTHSGAQAEHAHLSPIIEQQREAIRELVEGLKDALGGVDEEYYPNTRQRIRMLINKYKQQ